MDVLERNIRAIWYALYSEDEAVPDDLVEFAREIMVNANILGAKDVSSRQIAALAAATWERFQR